MAQEIIDLFADDPQASLTLLSGTYLGKEGVRRYFGHIKPDHEFLHHKMQLAGIIDVGPGGKMAKGRWYGFGAIAIPEKMG